MNSSIYTFNNIEMQSRQPPGGHRNSNPHAKGIQNGGDMLDASQNNSSKISGSIQSNNAGGNYKPTDAPSVG